jgi:allophanate hydrolase
VLAAGADPRAAATDDVVELPPDTIAIAVVGAHLTGEPLNHQLTSVGGLLMGAARTKLRYRLFALPGMTPPKPGLVRTANGNGASIEVEVWGLSPPAFGAFVDRVAAPLCIGKVELEDGRVVNGFLCEAHATTGARDISSFGGWRAYRRSGS